MVLKKKKKELENCTLPESDVVSHHFVFVLFTSKKNKTHFVTESFVRTCWQFYFASTSWEMGGLPVQPCARGSSQWFCPTNSSRRLFSFSREPPPHCSQTSSVIHLQQWPEFHFTVQFILDLKKYIMDAKNNAKAFLCSEERRLKGLFFFSLVLKNTKWIFFMWMWC